MKKPKNVMVFDIETVTDAAAWQAINGSVDIDTTDEATIMEASLTSNGKKSEMPRHHMSKVVCISVVLRTANSLKVWSLGTEQSSERDLVTAFFNGVEKYTPVLVSWNGKQYDMPILHYRGLVYGARAPNYWDMHSQNTRYSNYISRYHDKHIDLMDLIPMYHGKAYAKLNEIALMLGFPGKIGLGGENVSSAYTQGDLASIRNYCECDVLNTYLIYLRFQFFQGHLDAETYKEEEDLVRHITQNAADDKPHIKEFNDAWTQQEAHVKSLFG